MNEDSSIIHLRQPDEIDDPLTALLRSGARRLLEQAIEAEVEAFLASRKELKLADGRDRLVRQDLSALGAQPQDAVGSDHIRATAHCVLYLKADRTDVQGEFKISKSSAEGLVEDINNAMSQVAADQASSSSITVAALRAPP